jgi:hypothetical protein
MHTMGVGVGCYNFPTISAYDSKIVEQHHSLVCNFHGTSWFSNMVIILKKCFYSFFKVVKLIGCQLFRTL